MNLHVGIYDHLGWAVAVTATGDHHVVDRRRIDLIEPGVPNMPIHHPGSDWSVEAVTELVARVHESAGRATAASLEGLGAALPGPVTSVHLRAIPPDFPADVATQLRPPYESRADGIMYRRVIASAARARGWQVEFYDARTAETDAAMLLGARAEEVLLNPRNRLGPPWTKDHRTALAATILAVLR